MSDDRTFCSKGDCKHTECDRHLNKIINGPRFVSVAAFENTEYCLKKRKEKEVEGL